MSTVNPRYEIVRKTQLEIFRKSGIAATNCGEIVQLLGPEVIAAHLGLDYIELEEIPSDDSRFKTAGVLDRANKTIYVSGEFPTEQQRLTGMHEVVHWMLHGHIGRNVMHRDRPINSLPNQNSVDFFEWEATYIACLSLMPEKMVKDIFAARFRLDYGQPLELDEHAAFYLHRDIEELRNMATSPHPE